MKHVKVIQINAVNGYGSTGVIVKDIEKCLLSNKDESMIACAFGANKKDYKIGNFLDRKVHAVLARVLGKQGYGSFFSTKRLIKKLKHEKPDVVHLHNLHSNYIHLNSLLNYLADNRIATVITLHDCWFFTGKCFHFVSCGCEKWKTGCGNCPQNKSDIGSIFLDGTKQAFEDKRKGFQQINNLTIVGCSDWIKNLAEKSPVFEGKTILRIHNGVDTNVFKIDSENLYRGKRNLGGCFNILVMANKFFLQENSEIRQRILKGLKKNQKLLVVGCTKNQIEELRNYTNVIAEGFIKDRAQLSQIYSAADVFINMTYEDTLPTVNMESICCGTPVITYNSCGSPELIDNGKTGYVIPANNYTALLDAIAHIEHGEIKTEKCSAIGSEMFDKEKRYLDYIQLYYEIVNNS